MNGRLEGGPAMATAQDLAVRDVEHAAERLKAAIRSGDRDRVRVAVSDAISAVREVPDTLDGLNPEEES